MAMISYKRGKAKITFEWDHPTMFQYRIVDWVGKLLVKWFSKNKEYNAK